VDETAAVFRRLRRFASAVSSKAAEVDVALPAVRELLHAAGVPFRFVGGVAAVHHGYVRTSEDIVVLVEASRLNALDEEQLESHGFRRLSRARLEHEASGVRVDLLISRDPVPRRAGVTYPGPLEVEASERDGDLVGLAPLLQLKLLAGRYQDRADVVALLKRIDDAHYLPLEAAMSPALRPELARLRRDALEEAASDE
jgi:hypothetical protein